MFKRLLLLVYSLVLSMAIASASQGADNLRDLFWARSWPQMELLYNSQKVKTPADHALMANAYRYQERWQDALNILEAQSKNFPASVKPYADMTRVLGYEKLGQTQKALTLSETLYKNAPEDLKYYVALAQYRIAGQNEATKPQQNATNSTKPAKPQQSQQGQQGQQTQQGQQKTQQTQQKISALTRMLAHAGTDERKISTLKLLVPLTRDTNQALQLLGLQASSEEGARVLSGVKQPGTDVRVAMGVYEHSVGNNRAALAWLNEPTLATGRKAQYYRAWASSRLKQNDTALNLWGSLAISGNSYAASSVTRIAALAKDAGMREKCLSVLERIARERRGTVQARALQSLVSLYGKRNAQRRDVLEAQILRSFPNTSYAFNVLWAQAWRQLDAGRFEEAVRLFRQCDAPGVAAYKRARVLYWLEYAYRRAGQTSEAESVLTLLRRKYPLTIYGLISGADIRIGEGTNPNLRLKTRELDKYGN